MKNQIRVVFACHSGYEHTKVQANAELERARSIEGVYAEIVEATDTENKLSKIDCADAIIFGTPTDVGTVFAPFKAFMDASSSKWMEQCWKNKIAGGFTNSFSQVGDKTGTLQALSVFTARNDLGWA